MGMSIEYALELQALRTKLSDLRDRITDPAEYRAVQVQLDRIEPYLDEAGAVVIRVTDSQFQALADQIKEKMKPIDEAIDDIKKTAAALKKAAAVISAIISAVGAVAKV